MLKSLVVAALVLISGIQSATATEAPLELRTKLVEALHDKIALNVTVRNTQSIPVELNKADLPWGTRHALMLVAVTNDTEATRVDEALFIDDPGPGQVVLKPLGELSGSVDLLRRFPTLLGLLKTHEVIVFWSYRPQQTNGTQLQQISGAVILKKL
jgi:hypothetical protein